MAAIAAMGAEYLSPDGKLLAVTSAGNSELSLIDLKALGPKLPPTPERQGEINFNDAIGNPKNAKSMFLAHETPPAMALGVRDSAETAVRTAPRFIQFVVRPDEDAQAIDAYLRSYDVGTGTGQDAGKTFDTPTLREVWRTAPYLHDGRSATIEEVLTGDNPHDRHGKTGGLSERQTWDLAEYVRSL